MSGRSAVIGLISAAALVVAACTSTLTSNTNSPSPSESPSSAATSSPSSSPSSSTSSSPETSPSSSPSSGTPLAITSLPFHNGEVGVGYLAVTLGASGGTAPYTWSVGGGAFPPGLHLSTDGVVTGNNTAAGNFTFTVHVADSAGGTADASKTLKVYTALAVTQPCATVCAVEQGCTICGNFGAVSGGLPPYHLSILSDNRPTGMGITGLDLTGAFPGPGNYSVKIQVQDDQFGATRTVTANWSVFAHIAFSAPAATCSGDFVTPCSVQIGYVGGNPVTSPTVKVVGFAQYCPSPTFCYPIPTATPPGWAASASGGTVTITVPADCGGSCPNGGYGIVTIELVDTAPCGPGANCVSQSANVTVAFIGG